MPTMAIAIAIISSITTTITTCRLLCPGVPLHTCITERLLTP